jgi:transcription initiation factor TFIID subunit 6
LKVIHALIQNERLFIEPYVSCKPSEIQSLIIFLPG